MIGRRIWALAILTASVASFQTRPVSAASAAIALGCRPQQTNHHSAHLLIGGIANYTFPVGTSVDYTYSMPGGTRSGTFTLGLALPPAGVESFGSFAMPLTSCTASVPQHDSGNEFPISTGSGAGGPVVKGKPKPMPQ